MDSSHGRQFGEGAEWRNRGWMLLSCILRKDDDGDDDDDDDDDTNQMIYIKCRPYRPISIFMHISYASRAYSNSCIYQVSIYHI